MARNKGNKEETPVTDATSTEAPAEVKTEGEAKPKVDHAALAETFRTAVRDAISTGDPATGAIPEAELAKVTTAYKGMTAANRGTQLATIMQEINAEALSDPANVNVGLLQAAGAIQAAVARTSTARGGGQPREKAAPTPAYVTLATQWAAIDKAGEGLIIEGTSDEDVQKARELFEQFKSTGEAEGLSADTISSLSERIVKASTVKRRAAGSGSGGPRNSATPLDMEALNGKTFTHKAKDGERSVTVKDGKWVLDTGEEFTSATAAAKKVMGPTKDGKEPSVNGRRFWSIPS